MLNAWENRWGDAPPDAPRKVPCCNDRAYQEKMAAAREFLAFECHS